MVGCGKDMPCAAGALGRVPELTVCTAVHVGEQGLTMVIVHSRTRTPCYRASAVCSKELVQVFFCPANWFGSLGAS